MIALNITLMTIVTVGIVSLLGWAIVSDRRSKRTAGSQSSPATGQLRENLVMPHELRVHRAPKTHTARPRQTPARSAA